jgi:hypothetical protein
MIESIFQTFFFLATFDTILISVSIANYSISASYLGRETRLTRRRMEKRNEELDVKIKELQNKGLSIEDLEKETTKAKGYMNALKNRLFFLSWIGAVLVPSLFFIVSLVLSVLGINSDILLTELGTAEQDFLVHNLLLYSVISLGLGFSFLLLVIGIIDSAARRIPIPEFEVYFSNVLQTLKCKRKQMLVITLCIKNKGEDFAEDALVMVHFPPAFQLQLGDYRIIQQGPETDHPDYKSAIFGIERSYPDTIINEDVRITTPDDTEIHEIYVSIYETKSGHSEHKLTVQTTD